jgi:hypothetical protein
MTVRKALGTAEPSRYGGWLRHDRQNGAVAPRTGSIVRVTAVWVLEV